MNDQLTEAITARDAARQALAAAVTRKARRDADEDLNFWQGKVAALTISATLPADPFEGLTR